KYGNHRTKCASPVPSPERTEEIMTVRKNSKLLKHALANIISIRSFDLGNNFSGKECSEFGSTGRPSDKESWGWVKDSITRFEPTFRLDAPDTLKIRFHSNSWLTVKFFTGV